MKKSTKTNIMNKINLVFLLGILLLPLNVFSQKKADDKSAVVNLMNRVLPKSASNFEINIISGHNGDDYFEVGASGGKIKITANNALSACMAYNWYLRNYLSVSYDWQAIAPLGYKGKFPVPEKPYVSKCRAKERFFNNTCTFGYSFVWWNFAQWERFIDWMALNGINRPLMLAGQEAVWLNVWKSYGLTDSEIRTYFSSPAHLPWHRMTNLDKWGGPLPASFIDGQKKMQVKLLQRVRSLNMLPILSAFTGHVPQVFAQKHTASKITRIEPGWGGLDSTYTTYYLDPEDKLFTEIQERFLTEQNKLYGTDHLYSADPFNEITPPSWEPDYLAKIGSTIYQSMAKVDKDAKWYQMSWTFYFDRRWTGPRLSAMINAVPKGKLVFIDYVCEEEEFYKKSERFYGAPFLWSYLGNFGGNTHIVAPIKKVAKRIEEVLPIENCAGVGSTMEGLNVNPEIYEMMLELPWLDAEKFSVSKWIDDYSKRRAGCSDTAVSDAWKLFADKVLVDNAMGIWGHGVVLQALPSVNVVKGGWTNPNIPYKNSDLGLVIKSMLNAKKQSQESDPYQYDLVNFMRQYLGNYSAVIQKRIVEAYKNKDIEAFRKNADRFVELGNDVDSLLACRHEFLFGKWVSDARAWGKDKNEKNYYEKCARQLLTSWQAPGSSLSDYANRQWNGLMKQYYLPRWKHFFVLAEDCMKTGKAFNEGDFKKWANEYGKEWNNQTGVKFATVPKNNAVELCKSLYEKYKSEVVDIVH